MSRRDIDFNGKVVFISGAASGIGRQAALRFAEQGAHLALFDIDELGVESLADLIGEQAMALHGDISIPNHVERAFEKILQRFNKLDIAFNNAGFGALTSITECTESQWDKVQNVNLKGVWLCLKSQIKIMRNAKIGTIINNASILGLTSVTGADAPYVAAKHGVVGLTKLAALENADLGIRVNCICPASVATPMLSAMKSQLPFDLDAVQPLNRISTMDEVVNTVMWLASDHASYITGVSLPIDGGMMAGKQLSLSDHNGF